MYKRRYVTCKENSQKLVFNNEVGNDHVIMRETSLVDEFHFEKTFNVDGSESISVCDPISTLFNQQRLNQLGTTAAKAFIDSFAKQSDALSELRSKCSDEALMQMMKSRHLQSPSEILSWCRYMNENVAQFNEEVKSLMEQHQVTETETDNSNTE